MAERRARKDGITTGEVSLSKMDKDEQKALDMVINLATFTDARERTAMGTPDVYQVTSSPGKLMTMTNEEIVMSPATADQRKSKTTLPYTPSVLHSTDKVTPKQSRYQHHHSRFKSATKDEYGD